jgi:uncharacterized protein YjbJ (UPF0337 family)/anti-sigma regulatory factor (Ser/Thr protein kinase)
MPLDIDIRLSPGTRAPVEARRGLEALRPSLDDAVVDEAVLLVSEIVTNSVRHADLDPHDSIRVRVRGSPSMLHVDVIDPGAGFDPASLPAPNGQGGWGLWLLDRMATRWGVERDDVTRVWFELARPVSPRAPRGTSRMRHRHLPRGVPGEKEDPMGEMTDKAKGHAKEAVGDMTDDERLEREGKLDQMSGEVKGKAEDAKDKVGEGVDALKDKMRDDS